MRAMAYFLVALFLVACGTFKFALKKDAAFAAVDSDKAFDFVIKAGSELGFKPYTSPKPDKEQGFVPMYPGGVAREAGLASLGLLQIAVSQFFLWIQVQKEGRTATGVEVTVYHQGAETANMEADAGHLAVLYLETLKKYWKPEP